MSVSVSGLDPREFDLTDLRRAWYQEQTQSDKRTTAFSKSPSSQHTAEDASRKGRRPQKANVVKKRQDNFLYVDGVRQARFLVIWRWGGGLERGVGEGSGKGWGRVGAGSGKGWGRVGAGSGRLGFLCFKTFLEKTVTFTRNFDTFRRHLVHGKLLGN